METYQEFKKRQYDAISNLPIIYAFSNDQLDKALSKRGLSISTLEPHQLVHLGVGAYCLAGDDLHITTTLNELKTQLSENMQNYDFAYEAFLTEISNCEYHINPQNDFDVFNSLPCFDTCHWLGDGAGYQSYFDDLHLTETQQKAYIAAINEHLRLADENNWY